MTVTHLSRRAGLFGAVATFLLGTLASFVTALPAAAAGTCPAFGADTDCGVIITITDKGAVVSSTGQGPYDGEDDTMVGVINRSRLPIKAVDLHAAQNIFGFDGDGINTYGAPGNARDTTGYGGPNAYFTNINATQTAGRVNFITPLAPNGGTGYFSLEQSIATAVACSSIINNSITTSLGDNNRLMKATFTPKLGYTMAQAAELCGFTHFNWIQKITHMPNPSPYYARNLGGAVDPAHPNQRVNLTSARVPFNDPPPGGGYADPEPVDNSYPFYLNPTTELPAYETATNLKFEDRPGDSCLPGGGGGGCGGRTAPAGSYIGFSTHLAGIKPDGSAVDLNVGWTWRTTYNGTAGGVSVTKNFTPFDPSTTATGGITVTGTQTTTDYQYQGLGVDSVTPDAQSVSLKLRPWSQQPPVIMPTDRGSLSAVVESTPTFDAATIDPSTVVFGPAGAHPLYGGPIYPLDPTTAGGHQDEIFYFDLRDVGLQPGDTQLCLTGQTTSHQYVQGCAPVITQP